MATVTGSDRIAWERSTHEGNGHPAAQDDGLINGELLGAAVCYTVAGAGAAIPNLDPAGDLPFAMWPFDLDTWNPSEDPRRNLIKAGALIAAEIDRLDRAEVSALETTGAPARR